MGFTTTNQGGSVSFCRKLTTFGKNHRQTLMSSEQKFKKNKTHKNSYMRPLCITNLEYVDHG
jgi:hypothetical protein